MSIHEGMLDDSATINGRPTTLYGSVEKRLTTRKGEILEKSHRIWGYVEKWHNPLKIAAKPKREDESIMESERQRGWL